MDDGELLSYQDEILPDATTCIGLEGVMLSDIRLVEAGKCTMTSFIGNTERKEMNRLSKMINQS